MEVLHAKTSFCQTKRKYILITSYIQNHNTLGVIQVRAAWAKAGLRQAHSHRVWLISEHTSFISDSNTETHPRKKNISHLCGGEEETK